eukprot:TRINITY_DN19312_c0_g1_i1.p1 TRINITY_DN19312_c0_g1~~TRINITY_DN19312_c0_g1_i1.p1  ORF type:complete len:274 (+),score=66.26 TRINITY_DN19312_c0_g1_i1:111-824(+)
MSGPLEDDEVSKQLDNMVKFIYREAEEKAAEIKAKATEEADIEKAKIVQERKLKIMQEFETKEKQIEVKKRIAYSNALNNSRLKILKAREEGIQKLLEEAHARLFSVSKDPNYKQILQDLLLQALTKLEESKVNVIARKQDVSLVQQALPAAVEEYKRRSGRAVEAVIDSNMFLPPGVDAGGKQNESCSGGVIVSTIDGKIICSNTLDARLAIAFEQLLPEIRMSLYGPSATRKFFD